MSRTKRMGNFKITHIPSRSEKPRKKGITMVMDKGVGVKQVENFCESYAHLVDFVKLGFGTSYISKDVDLKLKLYREAGIKVYFGGTLFEVFIIRGMYDDYLKLLKKYKMDTVEVSDGSISIPHAKKCEYIEKLSKDFHVLSEVGSKEEGIIIHPARWIKMMNTELEAGSSHVIAEAREGGNVGIFHRNGSAHVMLINRIVSNVKQDRIIWETPMKSQQVYFIKHFGANVNLGNIGYDDVISLEALRLGLRGDTFFTFLPEDLKNK